MTFNWWSPIGTYTSNRDVLNDEMNIARDAIGAYVKVKVKTTDVKVDYFRSNGI